MARSFSVSDFRSNLRLGGARPTLFEVRLFTPPGLALDLQKTPFLVRSAEIPQSTGGIIRVPYFGREVKFGGDRQFPAWTVTVINDEDFKIRNEVEKWSNAINSMRGNLRLVNGNDYKANATVTQYGKQGDTLRTYRFEGLFPASISSIGLDWNDTDQIESFQIQFEYDNWVLDTQGKTGNIGNQG